MRLKCEFVMNYKSLLTLFILHITILNSNGEPPVETGNADNDDCGSKEADEMPYEDRNKIFILPSVLRILHRSASQENQPVSAEDNDCSRAPNEQRLIQDGIEYLNKQITHLAANQLLSGSLSEAREVFDDIEIVYDSLKVYWKFDGPSELRQVEYDCRQHHPKKALIKMMRRVTAPPQLLIGVVNGSRFNEIIFNATASLIATEVAIGAILAGKCDEILHGNSTAQEYRKKLLSNNLKIIEDAIFTARKYLFESYHSAVLHDVQDAIDHIVRKGTGRKDGVKYIHEILSNKYNFRVWAVLSFKFQHRNVGVDQAHEGTTDNWFHVNYRQYSVIVYSSNKDTACRYFTDKVRGKKLREIVNDNSSYEAFVLEQPEHLGSSIRSLRRMLLPHLLPQIHFMSIIKFRNGLFAEYDPNYHFLEHLLHPRTEKPIKTIFIGWC